FLAEYDSRVERETKGRAGKGQAGAPEEIAAMEQHQRAVESPGHPARPGPPGGKASRHRSEGGSLGQNGEADRVTSDGVERRPGAPGMPGAVPAPRSGEGGQPGRPGSQPPNLQPSEEMLARAMAKGAGSP